jgi:hypothetical protein
MSNELQHIYNEAKKSKLGNVVVGATADNKLYVFLNQVPEYDKPHNDVRKLFTDKGDIDSTVFKKALKKMLEYMTKETNMLRYTISLGDGMALTVSNVADVPSEITTLAPPLPDILK